MSKHKRVRAAQKIKNGERNSAHNSQERQRANAPNPKPAKSCRQGQAANGGGRARRRRGGWRRGHRSGEGGGHIANAYANEMFI